MDWREIETKLCERAEEVARHLMPNGKREGAEWVCGSLDGDKGRSLKVNLATKVGIWADFNGGSNKGNTLMSLWCSVTSQPFKVCIVKAKEFLGLSDDYEKRVQGYREAKGEPAAPSLGGPPPGVAEAWAKCEPLTVQGPVWKYLVNERGIAPVVLEWYGVREMISFGNWVIVYPYYTPAKEVPAQTIVLDPPTTGRLGLPTWLKFERLDRPEGKKREWTTNAPDKCLFGMQLRLLPQFAQAAHVLISEGEKDAMSWASYDCATWNILPLSVPFGAKWKGQVTGQPSPNRAWLDRCVAFLDEFETVFVAMDSDEPGRRAAADIINEIGPRRCRLVELPLQ